MLLALRVIHCEPRAVALGIPLAFFVRVSNSHFDSGMWQLRQAIFPASPILPSCPSCGVPACIGPESRGSKKSFCPSSAAAGESAYLLVGSAGRGGSGERAWIIFHSPDEMPLAVPNFLSVVLAVCEKTDSPKITTAVSPRRIVPPRGR